MLVTVTHGGYIKRTPLSLYRTQRRGGRGKIGATTSEADFVEHLVSVGTHDRLMFFTSKGKVYELKAYEVPEGGRAAKGRSIANLLNLADDERMEAFIPAPKETAGKYLFFTTRRGMVKKTALDESPTSAPTASSQSISKKATNWSAYASPTATSKSCFRRARARRFASRKKRCARWAARPSA